MNAEISPNISTFLHDLDIEYSAIPCDPALADTQAFCEHYGYAFDESANVLLVASKKGEPKFAACVVLANTRLDVNKTAKKKLEVPRISFANPDQTRELTGMELGGVTPFCMPDNVPVWVDSRVMQCERIVLGGGNRSSKILLAPQMLLKVPNLEVVEGLALEMQ